MAELQLRTGAWAGERELILYVPDNWDVKVRLPATPAPLTDTQIEQALLRPIGGPSFAKLFAGKTKPVVLVDDVNRPTPVSRILPILLRHFAAAGIGAGSVRILMAGGSHGAPSQDSVRNKLGEAYSSCEVLIHDPEHGLDWMGRTSFGTPVWASHVAAASDLVIGIGGLYPNHSLGFGGGSKLALGVLGLRSIAHLHYRHRSIGWGLVETENTFRDDLNEIARMLNLNAMITVHSNEARDAVRVVCGDPQHYFAGEVAFARQAYGASFPRNADVVIANAYPADLSLTFASMKGFHPLRHCQPEATRIAIASCSEGVGMHRVFPFNGHRRLERFGTLYAKLAAKGPREVLRKFKERARKTKAPPSARQRPMWIYRPGRHDAFPAGRASAMQITSSWPEILKAVRAEQGAKGRLRAVVYPCAAIQFLDPDLSSKEDECESTGKPTLLSI